MFSSASLRSLRRTSCSSRCSLGRLSVIDLNSLCASSCFLSTRERRVNPSVQGAAKETRSPLEVVHPSLEHLDLLLQFCNFRRLRENGLERSVTPGKRWAMRKGSYPWLARVSSLRLLASLLVLLFSELFELFSQLSALILKCCDRHLELVDQLRPDG